MKRATITVGQGFTKHGEPIQDVEEKRTIALTEAARRFGGYTMTLGSGGWIDDQKRLVEEPCMVLAIMSDKATPVDFKIFADFLKGLFGQEAVLVTVEWVEFAEFV